MPVMTSGKAGGLYNVNRSKRSDNPNHLKVVIPRTYSVDQGDGLQAPVV